MKPVRQSNKSGGQDYTGQGSLTIGHEGKTIKRPQGQDYEGHTKLSKKGPDNTHISHEGQTPFMAYRPIALEKKNKKGGSHRL